MKGTLLVIVNPDVESVDNAVDEAMEDYRFTDNIVSSSSRRYWDYWVFKLPDWADTQLAELNRYQNSAAIVNAAVVEKIPSDYVASAILDPAGKWHDIQDFGWTMLNEPSRRNRKAQKRWVKHFIDIKSQYANYLGVQLLVHS